MKNIDEIIIHLDDNIKISKELMDEVNKILTFLEPKISLFCHYYQILVEDFGIVYSYNNIRVCFCGARGDNKELFIVTKKNFDKCYEISYPKPIFVDSEFLDSLFFPQDIISVEGRIVE